MIQLVALRGQGTTNVGKGGQKILAKSLSWLFQNTPEVLKEIPEEERWNVYYTVGAHLGAEAPGKPIRAGKTFAWQEVVAFDIDGIDNARQQDYIQCVSQVLCTKISDLTIISSGGGLHFLVFVNPVIRDAAFFTKNKSHYNAICIKIDAVLADVGLPGHADPVVFEPARILRLPGTVNRKPGREDSECKLLQLHSHPIVFKLSEISGLGDLEKDNIPLKDVKRMYPNPDLPEILGDNGCLFMKWAFSKPEEIHEPHAFDYFSVLAQVSDSTTLLINGKANTPRDLAKYAFEHATASASLARQAFDAKWEQACRYGVRKCETIAGRFDQCNNCQHYGKITTPLDLKSPQHIGTKAQGFWTFDSRGNYLHPHYGDLRRQFLSENPYVSYNGQVIAFDGKKYVDIPPEIVRGWVENKVKPSDPVKEVHRMEAFHKIQSGEVLTPEAAEHLFEKSVFGKINFRNGIMDIRTGEFTPHTARIGFRYILPYDYDPEAISEYFMDWLETITLKRPEVMEMILDFMGYCFIPTYDDHCFAYLIGEGKNGKSTLIELITHMMGKENVSTVSIQQLTTNRFMPALLENKLVNLSEESSGKELNSEQLNVLKNLSSGGEMTVERKGLDGYTTRNRAKLIFSANRPPNFLETGTAIKRRLVVIPFDYHISDPDARVGRKLIEEAPGIVAMLIRRVREKLKEEGGRYRVSRGEKVGADAQKKLLFQNNPVMEWFEDTLEGVLDANAKIPVSEAFANYQQWCDEAGVKFPLTRAQFGVVVRNLLPATSLPSITKINNKTVRIFRLAKWKDQK